MFLLALCVCFQHINAVRPTVQCYQNFSLAGDMLSMRHFGSFIRQERMGCWEDCDRMSCMSCCGCKKKRKLNAAFCLSDRKHWQTPKGNEQTSVPNLTVWVRVVFFFLFALGGLVTTFIVIFPLFDFQNIHDLLKTYHSCDFCLPCSQSTSTHWKRWLERTRTEIPFLFFCTQVSGRQERRTRMGSAAPPGGAGTGPRSSRTTRRRHWATRRDVFSTRRLLTVSARSRPKRSNSRSSPTHGNCRKLVCVWCPAVSSREIFLRRSSRRMSWTNTREAYDVVQSGKTWKTNGRVGHATGLCFRVSSFLFCKHNCLLQWHARRFRSKRFGCNRLQWHCKAVL